MSGTGDMATCAHAVARDGFCVVQGPTMRGWLEAQRPLTGWQAFTDSWNELGPDTYLATHGRLRRRRYGVWSSRGNGSLVRQSHQPHFQSLAYNALQGDIERWFEPIADAVADSDPMERVLRFALDFFGPLAPDVERWHLEVHQFRIEAMPDAPGEPTPEGVHRDGVDYVLVLMVDRHNIASGTTTIHGPDGTTLGSFTLAVPFDAALVDDRRVLHGVTPVLALDSGAESHRDVLVVTLRADAGNPAG